MQIAAPLDLVGAADIAGEGDKEVGAASGEAGDLERGGRRFVGTEVGGIDNGKAALVSGEGTAHSRIDRRAGRMEGHGLCRAAIVAERPEQWIPGEYGGSGGYTYTDEIHTPV